MSYKRTPFAQYGVLSPQTDVFIYVDSVCYLILCRLVYRTSQASGGFSNLTNGILLFIIFLTQQLISISCISIQKQQRIRWRVKGIACLFLVSNFNLKKKILTKIKNKQLKNIKRHIFWKGQVSNEDISFLFVFFLLRLYTF